MLINSEKIIIKKGYQEFEGKNLWNYYKKEDSNSQILLYFDINAKKYIFEFPLNNSLYNYRISFIDFYEARNYIDYVVNEYL
tara:strand:- start:281 stop:526 length:246 start_codon:yes stop_codon:yes gene_type:complete